MNGTNSMKRVGLVISIFMCATLSLCLPMIGVISSLIQSGKFQLGMYLLNFIISFLISFLISMFLPTARINMALERKFGLKCHQLKTRILEAAISDLIYTPLLSVSMSSLAWYNIKELVGNAPPYLPMVISSLLISLAVAFIIIFIALPLYMRLALRICDVDVSKGRPDDNSK